MPAAALDPQVASVIEAMSAWDVPGDLVAASRAAALLEVRFGGEPTAVAEVADTAVETEAGRVALRVHRPHAATGAALLWIHGGGWICGTLDTCEPVARLLAASSGAIVVCPDYALSPEAPPPVALEQCYGVAGAVRRGDIPGVAQGAALAIGGDSAGANLAAGVALMSRDRSGPRLDLQVLCEPVLHPRWRSPSREAFATGTTITAQGLDEMWALYLQGDAPSGYTAPLGARDLSNAVGAIVVAGACDPLRDEARRYAARLADAGTSVSYREHAGLAHGIFTYFGVVDAAYRAVLTTAREMAARLVSTGS